MTKATTLVNPPHYGFYRRLARILNSGQSRSVLLSGHVHDLFFSEQANEAGAWVPLVPFLADRCRVPGLIVLVYELNGPIRVAPEDAERLRRGWIAWQMGESFDDLTFHALGDSDRRKEREIVSREFDRRVREAIGRPTLALEFMRQLAQCSRAVGADGRPYLGENLLMIIEAADMLLPAGRGDVTSLGPADRHRVTIMQDWFGDPGFMDGDDSVVLLAESRALVHPRVVGLPSVLTVEVPAPSVDERLFYIENAFAGAEDDERIGAAGASPRPELWAGPRDLAAMSAGLSIHALRQLLVGAAHRAEPITPKDVVEKVQSFIGAQLGEDVIEFKKPAHSLDDVVGFERLKSFIAAELLPRFKADDAAALPGAAVAGPIGGGKTFIFEAVAASLDLPVLVLKNLRSQWFGQTDVVFEKLRRVLESLGKVVIFMDEADTQFGGIGAETHATERRLTGKIQQMMSDPQLRGRVIWLLMTARIHLLSPDIRRPGRVGDLIIPVLDPVGDDHAAFVTWTLEGVIDGPIDDGVQARIGAMTTGYSAAAFASLRSTLRARRAMGGGSLAPDDVESSVRDMIPPAIGRTRRYQTLQALVNCTRRSLLPDPTIDDEGRAAWEDEIRSLEAMGVH